MLNLASIKKYSKTGGALEVSEEVGKPVFHEASEYRAGAILGSRRPDGNAPQRR
jgi:hypothetical protein